MKVISSKCLVAVSLLLPLSGCFIDETIDETKKVNTHLEQTNHSQALGGALLIMMNKEYPTNVRVGAAKTVFIEASDEKIGTYIGTPFPIEKRDAPMKVDGIPVSLSNVAYVRDERRGDVHIAPITRDVHSIQHLAVMDLLNTLSLAIKAPGLSNYDSDRINRVTRRLVPVMMAVLGAFNLDSLIESAHGRGQLEMVVPISDREDAVEMLMELVSFCQFTQEEIRDTRGQIETRLQVSAF